MILDVIKPISNKTYPHRIFYIDDLRVLYKKRNTLFWSNRNKDNLSQCTCPSDDQHYEFCQSGSYLIFIFGGKTILVLNRADNMLIQHNLHPVRIGFVVTPIYSYDRRSIVFGTKVKDRVQLMRYDFLKNIRIAQTQSWEVENISDLKSTQDSTVAVLSNTFLVGCNMNKGETEWSRFESGNILKCHLVNNNVVYACNHLLHQYTPGGDIKKYKTDYRPTSVEFIHDNRIYAIDNGKDLLCFHTVKKEVEWRLPAEKPVNETLVVRSRGGQLPYTLLLRFDNIISVVDLHEGSIIRSLEIDQLYQMRDIGKNVLLHRSGLTTDIIEGA